MLPKKGRKQDRLGMTSKLTEENIGVEANGNEEGRETEREGIRDTVWKENASQERSKGNKITAERNVKKTDRGGREA